MLKLLQSNEGNQIWCYKCCLNEKRKKKNVGQTISPRVIIDFYLDYITPHGPLLNKDIQATKIYNLIVILP